MNTVRPVDYLILLGLVGIMATLNGTKELFDLYMWVGLACWIAWHGLRHAANLWQRANALWNRSPKHSRELFAVLLVCLVVAMVTLL